MRYPAGNALLETLDELTSFLPEPAFYVVDAEGRILTWNAGCIRLFGYEEAEMVGTSWERLCASPAGPGLPPYLEGSGKPQQIAEDEYWHVRRDGTRFWANVLTTPFFESDGRLKGWIKEVRDYTQRHAELEQIRQQDREARDLLEVAPAGVARLDAELRVTYANPRLGELFGSSVEKITGRSLREFLNENDARQICDRPHPQRAKWLRNHPVRLRRSDDAETWVLLSLGNPPGPTGVSQDTLAVLTELTGPDPFEPPPADAPAAAPDPVEESPVGLDVAESASASDRRHRAQYEVTRVLVENAPVQETRENLLRVICESLGWTFGELWVQDDEDQTLRCAAIWYQREEQLEAFAQATRELRLHPSAGVMGAVWNTAQAQWGSTQHSGFRRTQAALDSGLQSMLIFPVTFVGHVQGVIGLYASELITVEPVLLETLDGIGRQLGEFTLRKQSEEALARSEEQLRQAQKMEAIGTLAGGVAHDFNNMLAVISGYSELILLDDGLDEGTRSAIDQIRSAADRAAGLTRQLLAFSRKQLLQPRRLDLVALTSDLGRLLRRLIGEDIELVTLGGPQPSMVTADPSQLEQVLMNLVVNARDAMPQGGKLTIEVRNVSLDARDMQRHLEATPGEYVMLAVSDTGCGMDRATVARVFEPFFTTKEPGRGTGLGLATVYGIVKQTGGEIWVYSEPGEGTTFKVFLPRADAGTSTTAAADRSPVLGSGTILLVEDEELLRSLVREVLTASGYIVLEAANGSAALRLAREHPGPISLLLTDVVMPQMSGQELSERLRAVHPDLKVLFMSGYTDDAVVRHGVQAAEVAFIQKPFSPHQLTRKVQEVIRGV